MSDKMRDAFEAWASGPEFGLSPGHFERHHSGEYANFPTQCYWEVWRASRKTLLVELPDPVVGAQRYQHAESAFSYKEGIDECRAAISDLGLKVMS